MNAPIRTRWWPRSCNTKRVVAFNDHWLDEKELFYETSVRIPMLLYDLAPSADATRGTTDERLVKALDLFPIFLDVLGADLHPHRLEGRSLIPKKTPVALTSMT
jgi:arylsulfatase A-like enzyme